MLLYVYEQKGHTYYYYYWQLITMINFTVISCKWTELFYGTNIGVESGNHVDRASLDNRSLLNIISEKPTSNIPNLRAFVKSSVLLPLNTTTRSQQGFHEVGMSLPTQLDKFTWVFLVQTGTHKLSPTLKSQLGNKIKPKKWLPVLQHICCLLWLFSFFQHPDFKETIIKLGKGLI